MRCLSSRPCIAEPETRVLLQPDSIHPCHSVKYTVLVATCTHYNRWAQSSYLQLYRRILIEKTLQKSAIAVSLCRLCQRCFRLGSQCRQIVKNLSTRRRGCQSLDPRDILSLPGGRPGLGLALGLTGREHGIEFVVNRRGPPRVGVLGILGAHVGTG